MDLRIEPGGRVVCLYAEAIDLAALGAVSVRRASFVEPDGSGRWWADLAPLDGPRLGPYRRRSDALRAEVAWAEEHFFGLSPGAEGAQDNRDGREPAGPAPD
jgi:hypothetical protein